MSAMAEELAERLAAMAEEIGDLAYDLLHQASSALGRGETADPAVLAEERRLNRARRAVEKAANILRGPAGADDGSGED